MSSVIHWPKETPAIVESVAERDRRECLALYQKADGSSRELAQWLLDHPVYTAAEVARWNGCNERKIQYLRKWAKGGFVDTHRTGSSPIARSGQVLKTNNNFEDDTTEPSEDMADPAHILENILDDIDQAKTVAEAYRKILKRSPFDREAKAKIYNAIQNLIVKWRTVQSTLDTKGQGNG